MPQGEWENSEGVRLAAFLVLLCACTLPASSQTKAATGPQTTPQEAAATDRQKAMQADMDRLLELARKLKNEVDSSRKDELSMKVVRDADEIDKLARSARGRIH